MANELRLECEAGSGSACREFADAVSDREVRKIYIKKACDFGDLYTCGELAELYINEISYVEAEALFEKGCEGGNRASCRNLEILDRD